MKTCAFGECLIDFTPMGVSEKKNPIMEQNPGGAPANLAVALARQHGESVFVGKVGKDSFGEFLIDTLKKENVDTQFMVQCEKYHTTLAFVHLQSNGERDFTFYRNPGADVMIESREIDFEVIRTCDLFHFGSLSMTHNPARTTTFELLEYAKRNNKIITYDPNLREPLWKDLDEARRQIKKGLSYCDILKVTEEELLFITKKSNRHEAMEYLSSRYHIGLILCTRAKQGCICLANGIELEVNSFKVNSIDSTGAGDAFFGSFLASFCYNNKPIEQLNKSDLQWMIRRANAAGALATTIKGAIPSLPTSEEVDQFLESRVHEV